MKKAFILLFLISGLSLFAQPGCSPNLKEIYSYGVGDVFQYQTAIINHNSDDINESLYISHQRNTVIEKNVFSDTIIIISDVRFYSWYEIPQNPYGGTKYMPSKKAYIDTLVIIDSESHFLNACDSQLVSFEINETHYYIGFSNKRFYSRVLINEQNGEIIKQIGNDDDFLADSISGDTLFPNGYYYKNKQLYSIGKGLVLQRESGFEWNKDIILEGYAINGDTTETVWRDEDFPVSTGEITQDARFRIYPTIVQNSSYLYLEYDRQLSDLTIISTDGRIQAYKWVDTNAIRLVNVPAGIYIVSARFGDVVMREKIIKRE